jgi:hypothetical protein
MTVSGGPQTAITIAESSCRRGLVRRLLPAVDAVLANKPGETTRVSPRILHRLTNEARDAYLKAHQRLETQGRGGLVVSGSNTGGSATSVHLRRSLPTRIDIVPFPKRT